MRDRSTAALLIGGSNIIDSEGRPLTTRLGGNVTQESILTWLKNWFPQQSTFWTRRMWEVVDPLDESLYYVMDKDVNYETAVPIPFSILWRC